MRRNSYNGKINDNLLKVSKRIFFYAGYLEIFEHKFQLDEVTSVGKIFNDF